MDHKSEISCQFKALDVLSSGDNLKAQEYCTHDNMIIAVIFREIIDRYEKNHFRLPTTDELIWLTSEKLEEYIRKLFND